MSKIHLFRWSQFIYPPVLMVVLILTWAYFILPVQKKLSGVLAATENINQKKLQLVDHLTFLTTIEGGSIDLTDLASRAIAYLPEKSLTTDFWLQLEDMVKSLGIKPTVLSVTEKNLTATTAASVPVGDDTSTKPTPLTTNPPLTPTTRQESQFLAELTGSFDQMLQFLNLFKTVDRLSTIENLNLTDEAGLVTATVEGKIYYQPLPQFAIDPDRPTPGLSDRIKELIGRQHFGQPVVTPAPPNQEPINPFGKFND